MLFLFLALPAIGFLCGVEYALKRLM